MIIRTIGLTACTLVLVAVTSLSTTGSLVERTEAGEGLTMLSLSPVSKIEPAGSDIEVDILVDNITDFGGYKLDIAYDPNVLQFDRWEDAGLLTATGRIQLCQATSVGSTGIVVLACSTVEQGGSAGPSGSGRIGELTFTTTCSGQSMITFRRTSLYGTSGAEILHSQAAGSFALLTPVVESEPCSYDAPTPENPDDESLPRTPTQTPRPPGTQVPPTPTPSSSCGDANGSGTVDAVDAALILFAIAGLTPAVPSPNNADVDGNGRLDSVDVLRILQVSAGLINRGALNCQ